MSASTCSGDIWAALRKRSLTSACSSLERNVGRKSEQFLVAITLIHNEMAYFVMNECIKGAVGFAAPASPGRSTEYLHNRKFQCVWRWYRIEKSMFWRKQFLTYFGWCFIHPLNASRACRETKKNCNEWVYSTSKNLWKIKEFILYTQSQTLVEFISSACSGKLIRTIMQNTGPPTCRCLALRTHTHSILPTFTVSIYCNISSTMH